MKQVITTKDIKTLQGHFIVQLNKDQDSPCMAGKFEANPGFWMEKRISFVGCIYGSDGAPYIKPDESLVILNGIYYCHGIYTQALFVDYFNDYVWTDSKGVVNEDNKGKRYHRLLTGNELDWLNKQLKKQ